MKGIIKPDHIPVNKWQLIIIGLPPLNPIEQSGMEDELQVIDLPDRTTASGGTRNPSEFTIMIAAHHTVEIVACEIWYREGQEPVLPTYKKAGTIIMKSLSGKILRTRSIVGAYISKRTDPDLELGNEGDMAMIEYTIKVDDVLPF